MENDCDITRCQKHIFIQHGEFDFLPLCVYRGLQFCDTDSHKL